MKEKINVLNGFNGDKEENKLIEMIRKLKLRRESKFVIDFKHIYYECT